MAVPTYPLARPPAGLDVHVLPVERVNQAILFSQLRTAELIEPDGTLIDVALVPDLADGGWRIRWGYGTIGSLPAEARQAYPGIDHVTASHQQAGTCARVCVDREAGRLVVTIELPDPALILPRNQLPGHRVLPQGEPVLVDAAEPDGQYLVTVSGADVLLDDGVIATLSPADAGRVLGRTAGVDRPAVRLFSLGETAFLDLGPGDPVTLPELPPLPEPEPEVTPGAWAVTMPAEELAEPAPAGSTPLPGPPPGPVID